MTHDDILAAIDKARRDEYLVCGDCRYCNSGRAEACYDRIYVSGSRERNAHRDDLAALMTHHRPFHLTYPIYADKCQQCVPTTWPCPTVRIVTDRLQKWGVL